MRKILIQKLHKGFTLMEVMVSVSIFAIIVTVGIVALLTINDAYRKSQSERQAIDGMTYMLESMSRRIRTASAWENVSYGSSTNRFEIVDQDGIRVTYHYDYGPGTEPSLYMDVDNGNATNPVPTGINYALTPDAVRLISTLPDGSAYPAGGVTFTPKRSATGQPYVQINIGGYVVGTKGVSPFAFQTGISKRVSDDQPTTP